MIEANGAPLGRHMAGTAGVGRLQMGGGFARGFTPIVTAEAGAERGCMIEFHLRP